MALNSNFTKELHATLEQARQERRVQGDVARWRRRLQTSSIAELDANSITVGNDGLDVVGFDFAEEIAERDWGELGNWSRPERIHGKSKRGRQHPGDQPCESNVWHLSSKHSTPQCGDVLNAV